MIYKSYLIEENFGILKNNLVLFYGENLGLIQELKKKAILIHFNNENLKYTQEEILSNSDNFFNELKNRSLFNNDKTFFIDGVTDKFFNLLENIFKINSNCKIYLFAGVLEKKSKLRAFCERNNTIDVIPCYQDTTMTIKKLISVKLKDKSGLTPQIIDIIMNNCNNERLKLNVEISKIKSFFLEKKLNIEDIYKLLNSIENEDFNKIKDTAILGDANETNKLLNSTFVDAEKLIYYLSFFNQRFLKLKEILVKKQNIEKTISEMKPPIFWKDKPIMITQAKKWSEKKINEALKKTFKFEFQLKSNALLDKKIILKKFIIDICNLANAA